MSFSIELEDVEECFELDDNSCTEEPPAWHEAIVEKRYQAWKEGKITSRDAEEVFRDLQASVAKR
ncbi:MAG: addiction module protein [Chthoniobacterales bacterium]|nr:addiction module protein [Chthoniobacterales bacterium]